MNGDRAFFLQKQASLDYETNPQNETFDRGKRKFSLASTEAY